jgi:hypothetical protein
MATFYQPGRGSVRASHGAASFRQQLVVFTTQRKETTVPVQVTAIMIGVRDLARAKKFYGEGLGCAINKDYFSDPDGHLRKVATSG